MYLETSEIEQKPQLPGLPSTMDGRERLKSAEPGEVLIETSLKKYEKEFRRWLNSSRSIRILKYRITTELNNFGVTDWAYSRLDIPMDDAIGEQIGTNSKEICREYVEEEFYKYDFALKHVMASNKPVFQSDIDRFLAAATIESEDIIRNRELSNLNKRLGYFDAFQVPVLSGNNGEGRAVFTICAKNMEPREFRSRICRHLEQIVVIARIVDTVGTHKFPEHFIGCKTNHEKFRSSRPGELLRTMVNHDLTLNEAAARLNMKVSTAEKHMMKVRQVLGARTTYGAIRMAMAKGYL